MAAFVETRGRAYNDVGREIYVFNEWSSGYNAHTHTHTMVLTVLVSDGNGRGARASVILSSRMCIMLASWRIFKCIYMLCTQMLVA